MKLFWDVQIRKIAQLIPIQFLLCETKQPISDNSPAFAGLFVCA